MDKNSEEYKEFKAKYDTDQKFRRDHPELYPWFEYKMFGFHQMSYLSDSEVEEAVKFYHLHKTSKGWERYGRQPIVILRREKTANVGKVTAN